MQCHEIKAKQLFKGKQTAGVLGKQHSNSHTTEHNNTSYPASKASMSQQNKPGSCHCPGQHEATPAAAAPGPQEQPNAVSQNLVPELLLLRTSGAALDVHIRVFPVL